MGRSGRPNFPHIKTSDDSPEGIKARVTAAENVFVDSLEEFRVKSKITTPMTLVGHSIVRTERITSMYCADLSRSSRVATSRPHTRSASLKMSRSSSSFRLSEYP